MLLLCVVHLVQWFCICSLLVVISLTLFDSLPFLAQTNFPILLWTSSRIFVQSESSLPRLWSSFVFSCCYFSVYFCFSLFLGFMYSWLYSIHMPCYDNTTHTNIHRTIVECMRNEIIWFIFHIQSNESKNLYNISQKICTERKERRVKFLRFRCFLFVYIRCMWIFPLFPFFSTIYIIVIAGMLLYISSCSGFSFQNGILAVFYVVISFVFVFFIWSLLMFLFLYILLVSSFFFGICFFPFFSLF